MFTIAGGIILAVIGLIVGGFLILVLGGLVVVFNEKFPTPVKHGPRELVLALKFVLGVIVATILAAIVLAIFS